MHSSLLALILSVILGLPSAFGEGLEKVPVPDKFNEDGTAVKTPNPRPVVKTVERYWVVVRALTREERTAIAETGMSIEEVGPGGVAGVAHTNAIEKLKKLGFVIEHQVSLKEYTIEEFPPGDEAYHDYSEVTAELQGLASSNPGLVSLFSIGKSVQGRDLWTIRFNTASPGRKSSEKPGIVFMGEHHAREHLSVEVPLLMAVWLCENKEREDVKRLLETRDIYIIPMVNPDGAEYDIETGKYRMHRKNMSDNGDGTIGVDPNRNYGYKWGGAGSSGDTRSDTYRGPCAFSEPETQAIRDFISTRENITILMSYHSYSKLILYPWGWTYDPIKDSKDLQAYKAMAREMARITGYTPQQSSDLYRSSGDTTDWSYGTKGIFSFTIELPPKSPWQRGGFYPGPDIIESTAEVNTEAGLYLIGLADDPYRAIKEQPAIEKYREAAVPPKAEQPAAVAGRIPAGVSQ